MLMLGALALAAGCVQIEQDLTLKSDGSGVVNVAYAAPEAEQTMLQQAAREMLRQTLAVSGGSTRLPQDMTDAEIRKQFAGYARLGVKLEQLTSEHKAGRLVRRGVITFKTLDGLARALLPERTVALSRDARGDYLLVQQAGGHRLGRFESPRRGTVQGLPRHAARDGAGPHPRRERGTGRGRDGGLALRL